ncbi:MAG: helix-turn-helix domain-containing protein [Clostridia bacterium]|nr:helix-turn-helix domain-containing protein [Clostridia bacterium]
MANITDNNHFTIQGWMRTRLNLEGINLLVFAIVYSFSQDGESEFRGSIDYIKDFIGKSRDTVMRSLKSLEDCKLVKKINHNTDDGKTNGYIVDIEFVNALIAGVGGYSKLRHPPSKMQYGVSQNAAPGVANCDTINKSISKSISKSIEKERKKEYIEESNIGAVDFSQMSDEELLTYGERFNDGVDMTSDTEWETWLAYDAELKKRGTARKAGEWKGKIVVNEYGRIERLKSYTEVIAEWGFSKAVVSALDDFIQHCLLNKQRLTNEKLNDICFRLEDLGDDDSRLDQIKRAIKFGYYDIAAEGMLETARRLSRQKREEGV